MGWSEMEGRCRRHPKHRLSKGVCPSCLRERLSQLSASSSTNASSSLSSPGSSYDSVSSSTPSSYSGSPRTDRRRRHHPRDAGPKISFLTKEGGGDPLLRRPGPLTKSRSLAFVISNPLGGGRRDKKEKMKTEEEEKNNKLQEGADDKGDAGRGRDKKKRGFWSKLAIGGKKRKDKEAFSHSKTVRETSSARWTFLP